MCRPAVDSHNPSDSTQYSNSDANPRSRKICRSSSSARYARNSAVTWLRRPTTFERPAKSSSSASDFKRYSYCPIALVYHAHFRARKTPIALLSGSKPVPTRLDSTRLTIIRPRPNQASSHANIPSPRVHRLATTQKADELVESDALRDTRRGAASHSALAPHRHASADSTNSYAHAAGSHL